MKINFRLGKRNKNEKKGVVRMDFSYNGKRFRKFLGISIDEKLWSHSKQRFKSSASNSLELNKRIETIEKETIRIYYDLLNNNITPSNAILKEKLNESISGKSNQLSFYQFFDDFIDRSKLNKKQSTVNDYIYTLNDLKAFEKYNNRRIEWDTLDMHFYDSYEEYQYNHKGNSQNLFGKRIKCLKTVLNEAYERGLNKHLMFKGFKKKETPSEQIYLNEEEIKLISELDLSKKLRLDKVRDSFLFLCNTGLRFEDMFSVRKENVLKNSIKIKIKKTGQILNTLLLDQTKSILEKYDYKLPRISSTNFNKYIKEIGDLAGIKESVIQNTYKSGKEISVKRKKFEMITIHTARRSFATNMYHRGISPVMIMSITGHKKESTFLKYIKITNEEAIKVISMSYKNVS